MTVAGARNVVVSATAIALVAGTTQLVSQSRERLAASDEKGSPTVVGRQATRSERPGAGGEQRSLGEFEAYGAPEQSAFSTHEWGEDDSLPAREPRGRLSDRIPDVVFISHEGKPVRFFEDVVQDRKVAVNFMYTVCKGICPGMTRNIKAVRQLMADEGVADYLFVSISIEPEKDSPEQLARYMAANGIRNEPGVSPWIFLTGDLEAVDAVRRSLGVYEIDPVLDADRTQHGGILTYGNDKSDWWGAIAALTSPESIKKTMLRITGDDNRGLPRLVEGAPGT